MKMLDKLKKKLSAILDVIFYLLYVALMVIALLDIFGIFVFVKSDDWTKILVMIFGSVGLVTIFDKRKLEEGITPEIKKIVEKQDKAYKRIDEIERETNTTLDKLDSTMQIEYFPDKTQFYLYLTKLLLQLPSGAKIDVTSFEKNYDISYDIGEDRHIESFMKTWIELVQEGRLIVRQLVHVTSSQDYKELKERIENFKTNHNFTMSAMVGLPIVPFVDYMIINQEYVFMGFSNDVSSPYNFSYGLIIKGKDIALNFHNYFNIYWNNQFSFIIKDKDEIKSRNIEKIGRYVFDIDHNINLTKYNFMILELYHINECNRTILPLLENLHEFYNNPCCDILKNDIEKNISSAAELVYTMTHKYIVYEKKRASELMAKMMFNAKHQIYAVSLDIDGSEFWMDNEGERVFQANIDAITKQKVMVERIFVCTKDKQKSLEKIIREQMEAGIKIIYTEYKKGMGGTFEDFMIVDSEALLIFQENDIKISMNHTHINEYKKKYQRIREMGTTYL